MRLRIDALAAATRLDLPAGLPQGVEVWKIPLHTEAPVDDAALLRLLSTDEVQKATKFVFDRDRRSFVRTRAAVRLLLGTMLETAPAELAFVYGDAGKPELALPWALSGLQFNVAHSGDWALVAIAQGMRVGVDIERIRPEVCSLEIARRYFSQREADELEELTHDREEAFFRCWTRKEACLKAVGLGIGALDAVEVSLRPDEAPRILAATCEELLPQRWHLAELAPAAGYAAALAVEATPPIGAGKRPLRSLETVYLTSE